MDQSIINDTDSKTRSCNNGSPSYFFSILKDNKGRGMLPYFKAEVLQYMYKKHRFVLSLVNRIKSLGKMVINH